MLVCPVCNARYEDETKFCPKDGAALVADQAVQSLTGQVIAGRYRLTKLLGQGGMGEVYAAEHVHITKKVAIKVLHPEISSNPEALARFRQEAQSASSIGHDNIVAIDDFGQMDDGRFYLCMEFLEGESLSDAMAAPGGMDPNRALDVMIQVCHGLGAAHAKNIVHRDMKPENVFLTTNAQGQEVVKILDFGIAKVSGTDENSNLTKTGTVFGTPHYMSPEQALGQRVDQRADVYSMGVMLFEIFTGQVPFKAESFMGILSQHITKPPPSPSMVTPGRQIPKAIEDVILRSMAKEPDGRFNNVDEIATVLQTLRDQTAGVGPVGSIPAQPQAAGVAPTMMAGGGQTPMPTPAPNIPSTHGPQAGSTGPQAQASADNIPRTMMSQPGQVPVVGTPPGQMGGGAVPVVPSPPPQQMRGGKGKRGGGGNKGLIIGLVIGLVVIGGGAAAAVVFWDDITGNGGGDGTGSGALAKAGSGSAAGTGAATNLDDPNAGSGGTAAGTAAAGTGEPPPGTGGGTAMAAGTGATPGTGEPPPGTGEPPPGTADGTGEPPSKMGKTPDNPPDNPPTKNTPPPKVAKNVPPPTKNTPPPKVVEPPPPQHKSRYRVRLVTRPSNVAILQGGVRIGRTPHTFTLRRGGSVRVLLAKGGWRDRRVTVRAPRTGLKDRTVRFSLRRGRSGKALGIPGNDPF